MERILPSGSRSRSIMAAVVLGTAMTALATGNVEASEVSPRAVNDISRYCQACWRNARLPADRWGDCTQQVFTRLLERVEPTKWENVLALEGDERKEFLRAIDTVKKRTQRTRKYHELTHDFADAQTEVANDLRERRDEVALAAQTVLSPRHQRILELTVGGWAVPEIATELGTTVERVSDEKYKAIRKLRAHFGVV